IREKMNSRIRKNPAPWIVPRKTRMLKTTVLDPSSATPPQIDHKAVGARLRNARKARGLTLAQLSERSGIAVSTISKGERGDIALTYDKFAALAHTLKLDLDAVFGRPKRASVTPMT